MWGKKFLLSLVYVLKLPCIYRLTSCMLKVPVFEDYAFISFLLSSFSSFFTSYSFSKVSMMQNAWRPVRHWEGPWGWYQVFLASWWLTLCCHLILNLHLPEHCFKEYFIWRFIGKTVLWRYLMHSSWTDRIMRKWFEINTLNDVKWQDFFFRTNSVGGSKNINTQVIK